MNLLLSIGMLLLIPLVGVGLPLLAHQLFIVMPNRRWQRQRWGRPSLRMRSRGGRLEVLEVIDPRLPEYRK